MVETPSGRAEEGDVGRHAGLERPSGLSTRTWTPKTRLSRSAWVCTLRGVNSARGFVEVTTPLKARSGKGSTVTVTCWPTCDLAQIAFQHIGGEFQLVQVGDGSDRLARRNDFAGVHGNPGDDAGDR